MLKSFSQGDPLFMGMLTLILILLIAVFVKAILKRGDEEQVIQSLQWLRLLGILGLVVGVFGQLIGLYNALSVIEQVPGVSPAILAGGIKISLITTLYGFMIYIMYLLCSMILKWTR